MVDALGYFSVCIFYAFKLVSSKWNLVRQWMPVHRKYQSRDNAYCWRHLKWESCPSRMLNLMTSKIHSYTDIS